MSAALALADLIALRLTTAPATGELSTAVDLTTVPVLVDRQKSIRNEIDSAVAKGPGTAIIITWGGWAAADKNASSPRLAHRYNIAVWSRPILAGENLAADDVLESCIKRLWQWVPDGWHANGECVLSDGAMVPNLTYLVYDFEVTIPASL